MAQKKKLQVFVSSTYKDLQEERQSAVQAILTAGHIPAGMELFAAGDETQMNVIKRWIDESDVYMLILGGRYGSIEPNSQKSYIHLEYEYAVEKGKPLFAVVINEDHLESKIKQHGSTVFEKEHQQKLRDFRELVCSKMVRFWNDPKDIKLAIMETMADFANRAELIGWIPGNEAVNSGAVAEEFARLVKDNADLREKIATLSNQATGERSLSFMEMCILLKSITVDPSFLISKPLFVDRENQSRVFALIENILQTLGDTQSNLLHYLWMMSTLFNNGIKTWYFDNGCISKKLNQKLYEFGLIEQIVETTTRSYSSDNLFKLTDDGKQFLLRLRLETKISKTEDGILGL